jgi:hypothetical protein
MGLVAAAKECPQRAARMWGASEAVREATGERRWSVFQPSYERAVTVCRAQLSQAEWQAAWAAGHELTVAEAVTEALEAVVAP